MTNLHSAISRWSALLLDPDASLDALAEITSRVYHSLWALVDLEQEGSDDAYSARMPTFTEEGIALGLKDAALCLSEHQRTCAYVCGLEMAVAHKLSEGNRPVRVFYAGCGPFATLILPLFTRFTPDQLQIVLLDLHPEAIDGALTVIDHLGGLAYIAQTHVADATHFQFHNDVPDIIVTETLQRALTKESQVPIVINLVHQVPDTTIMVPEEIIVSGHLLDRVGELMPQTDQENSVEIARRSRVDLGPIFVLNARTIRRWERGQSESLPAHTVLCQPPATTAQAFCLLTRIRTFGPHRLIEYESSLTLPHPMPEVPIKPGLPLKFSYALGRTPGLVYVP